MTKSELVQRLYRRMHDQWMAEMLKRPKRDRNESPPRLQEAERVVTTIFDEIAEALSRGDRVELRGFGAFSVKDRQPRIGRNPRTGEAVPVEGKRVPYFKTGKELRERLNQD